MKGHLQPFVITFTRIICSLLLSCQCSGLGAGQTPAPDQVSELPPNTTLERELKGGETHRYSLALKAGEFFQVRVEQKSVDVELKLLDANAKILATMDSPSGRQGPETLSFVAEATDSLTLAVTAINAKAEKGSYSITRQPPRAASAKDRRRVEVERVFVEGVVALNAAKSEISIKKLQEALTGWQELSDVEMARLCLEFIDFQTMNQTLLQAHRLQQEADALRDNGRKQTSLEFLNASRLKTLAAEVKFREAGALATKLIADHPQFVARNATLKNFPYHAKAGELNVAAFLAAHHDYLLEPLEQKKYAQLALSLAKELRTMETTGLDEDDKILSQVNALSSLASAMARNNEPAALDFDEEVLSQYRRLDQLKSPYYNKNQEAIILYILNTAYSQHGLCRLDASTCERKAIAYAEQAIALYEVLGDKVNVGYALLDIATSYRVLNQVYKALDYSNRALSIFQSLGNKELIARALTVKATIFVLLGANQQANDLARQICQLLASISDYKEPTDATATTPFDTRQRRRREHVRLSTLVGANIRLADYANALEVVKQAQTISKLLADKSLEASDLSYAGLAYRMTKDWDRALSYYQQSLLLSREVGDKADEARTLVDVGIVQLESKRPNDALASLTEAQLIFASLGSDDVAVSSNLARVWYALGNRPLAIFYGKKLLEWINRSRNDLREFDNATQRGFLYAFEKPIRRLSDWLIEEGRIGEAEQLLELIKNEEVLEYVSRDGSEADKLSLRGGVTEDEQKALKHYREIADRIAAIGVEYSRLEALESKGLLTGEKADLFKQRKQEIQDANLAFQAFLKQLADEFATRSKTPEDMNETLAVQPQLRSWGSGVVFLYTLVGDERYRVILVTPDAKTDAKAEIKSTELNQKIAAFRETLRNPRLDPHPLGKELYDLLIRPIEKQLEGAGAKTLLWSLDGDLRLLPLAALWDGQQYFGQKYRNVIVTLASRINLSDQVSPTWRALGLGVSEARTVAVSEPDGKTLQLQFPSLPGVRPELSSIVRSKQSPQGVLPGESLVDAAFNEATLESALARRYKVIHIASHFQLNRGNSSRSFLLLGDGDVLTVEQFRANPRINLSGVDLLTLSACETAMSEKDSSGREVEGFGYVAQQKGAKAILATLWSVADESTSLFMSEFYRLRKQRPGLTKAGALQEAQREMIEGKLKPSGRQAGCRTGEAAGQSPASFRCDVKAPYSHPYFWSPFVLIGNWR